MKKLILTAATLLIGFSVNAHNRKNPIKYNVKCIVHGTQPDTFENVVFFRLNATVNENQLLHSITSSKGCDVAPTTDVGSVRIDNTELSLTAYKSCVTNDIVIEQSISLNGYKATAKINGDDGEIIYLRNEEPIVVDGTPLMFITSDCQIEK